ncbi:EamA family transporter, partial [Streptomyces sp. NPDC127044]
MGGGPHGPLGGRGLGAPLPLITLCGATGMTAYQVLLNWGEVHVEAGTASLLIAIAPVFSVLLGSVFLGERLTRT